jgi:hypothetical protein
MWYTLFMDTTGTEGSDRRAAISPELKNEWDEAAKEIADKTALAAETETDAWEGNDEEIDALQRAHEAAVDYIAELEKAISIQAPCCEPCDECSGTRWPIEKHDEACSLFLFSAA